MTYCDIIRCHCVSWQHQNVVVTHMTSLWHHNNYDQYHNIFQYMQKKIEFSNSYTLLFFGCRPGLSHSQPPPSFLSFAVKFPVCHVIVHRPHPLMWKNSLVNQVKASTHFTTVKPSNIQNILQQTCSKKVRIPQKFFPLLCNNYQFLIRTTFRGISPRN